MEGIKKKIIAIKYSINKGLTDNLKVAFPNITPVSRPLIQNSVIPDPYWVAGFMSDEGCLLVRVRKSNTNQLGFNIELLFQITQHTRDRELLICIKISFGCGKYREKIGELAGDFHVSKLSDITQKIIPYLFFFF